MRKYILLIIIATLTLGCKEFSFMSFGREEPIATVGSNSLYLNDVKGIFSPGMSVADSLNLLQAHVDQWVRMQIKSQEAERMFEGEQSEFDALIEAYKNSLLRYKYDLNLSSLVDTTITMAQITEYYNQNREQLRLVGPVAKARVISYPSGYRQEKTLKELIGSPSTEDYYDLVDIAKKSSFKLTEYTDKWHYFKDVLLDIPFTEKEFDKFLRSADFYQYKDKNTETTYMMGILAYRNTGDYIPLEMVLPTIRTAIINKRRNDYIKLVEDSLYNERLRSGDIHISLDTLSSDIKTDIIEKMDSSKILK